MENIETLRKLVRNPHYKLNDKQKKALEDAGREPIKSFGPPETHNATIPKHEVKVKRPRVSRTPRKPRRRK